MTEEEFLDHLISLRYFHFEKGDMTRYAGWEKVKPFLEKRRPDIYQAWQNTLTYTLTLDNLLKGI